MSEVPGIRGGKGRQVPVARSGATAVLLMLILLAVSCATSHPAGTARRAAPGGPPPATVSGGAMRALAAAYLAIARPANDRPETEVDGFTRHDRDDLAMAEADLRAEAATEHRFDQLLSEIPWPPRIGATARALIQANQRRAALTGQQAGSSSVTGLLSFAGRHRAADTAVEARVRVIRRELGLPPPQTS